jgi:aminomethyltransferase
MDIVTDTELRRSPFFSRHLAAGAKMFSFAGWEMPVQYTGIIEEHNAVRTSAGLFDVSHIGNLIIRGNGAKEFLRGMLTNNIDLAVPGKGIYAHILKDDGTIIDDTIVYNLGADGFLLAPNASTKDAVLSWLNKNVNENVEIIDVSAKVACLAIQGPKAVEIAQRTTGVDVSGMKRFGVTAASIGSKDQGFIPDILECGKGDGTICIFARTGYTGEDGFEIYVGWDAAGTLWDSLVAAGGRELALAGFGCRDTLRLEKGMLLSGTDFDGRQSSLQTGPPWVIKWDHEFIGKEAMEAQKGRGVYDVLVPLVTDGKNIPRHGYIISKDGKNVGFVTSGTLSPMLKKGIALGYVPLAMSSVGTEFEIDVRGRPAKAEIVKLPFV